MRLLVFLMALVIVLLGTPSISWCQEPPASATFQTVARHGLPSTSATVTVTSEGVKAVRPAEAGKHPELRTVLRSDDWKQCAFVDNRDGRYRGTPRFYTEDHSTPQLWAEIRWRLPEFDPKTPPEKRFYPVPHVFIVDANDADAVHGFLEARKLLGERCVDTPLAPLPTVAR